jgi:hypothetical protein
MLRYESNFYILTLLAGSGRLEPHLKKKKAASGTARPYNKFKYAPQMQEARIKWGEYVSYLTMAKAGEALEIAA